VWEFAETLEVTEDFLRVVIEYFTERRGMKFEAPWDA
jgi:hypothetical protein